MPNSVEGKVFSIIPVQGNDNRVGVVLETQNGSLSFLASNDLQVEKYEGQRVSVEYVAENTQYICPDFVVTKVRVLQ